MTNLSVQLETSRQTLLDLSMRNRLLNIPKKSKTAKIIEITDELSAEVYRLLVEEGNSLTFIPLPSLDTQKISNEGLAQNIEKDLTKLFSSKDDSLDEQSITKRRGTRGLQTHLTSESLQKRLLTMHYDAKTFREEQGVNILYLAIGMLKWFEDENSEVERYSPLILVPVEIERGNATERFKLSWCKEECTVNLSLQTKIKAEFGLMIPDLSEDDIFDVRAYMREVQTAVSPQKRFMVLENEMVLGFFSFAKFLMYRDLDPANWPENTKLNAHPLIMGLMRDGFPTIDGMIAEDDNVDKHLTPAQMLHVVDADGSQTLAIEEVRRGHNMVIQGPPGTGKSQTITNIIASAVADGKKVLFVAEKMAALEVVHRRMENIGLSPLCLELHSHKATKRSILEELKRTKELEQPRSHSGDQVTKLAALRHKLNTHAAVLHTQHYPSGLTVFQIISHFIRLQQEGTKADGIVLEQPESWTGEDKHERDALLAEIVTRVKEIGTPAQHIWRGVCRSSLLPNEYDQLFCNDLKELNQLYIAIMKDVHILENSFPTMDKSINSLYLAATAAGTAVSLPEGDFQALANSLWQDDMLLLSELIQSGIEYAKLREELKGKITDKGMSADLREARQQLAIHGDSFLRFLKSRYRESLALLKSYCITPLPKLYADRLKLIDNILAIQELEKFLHEQHKTGASAYGRFWRGLTSDWTRLKSLVDWRNNLSLNKLPSDFLVHCSQISSPSDWRELANRLQKQVPEFFTKLDLLFTSLQLETPTAFCAEEVKHINRDALIERLTCWMEDREGLSKWITFKGRYDALSTMGVGGIAEKLWSDDLTLDKIGAVFDKAYFDVLIAAIFTAYPQLREFDGDQHNLLVTNFRECDRSRIEQTRIELRIQHYKGIPHHNGGIDKLGVLNGEFAKKRNHLSLRQLLKRSGAVIQALKPIFMMSPLSVAQFLEPGALEFDLLVIDEASQIEPVDALGAIARAKQVVVVGDTCQLPPTRFFSRMTSNDEDEYEENEESSMATQDVESILNLCLARGLPQRMLRWHYRSRHQSLIAVSNKEFYKNKLFIVPSPYDAASDLGLKFNHLPHTTFDSGNTRTNPIEAKAVAQEVIQHAKKYPGLSLGVGTFSIKQKQAILDELEILRRANPETEPFFIHSHPNEPFFIKNLENIQGDERDVIFISVGYGRNQTGYIAMRFGPLSVKGGERRLNVLISRAKRRCEVFSSITSKDIDLERAKGEGVAALKLFLEFAETGKLDFRRVTDREADSIFEEQVATALRSHGYEVKIQIGIAGFFIDMAIVDQECPGRFILGIECDGTAYHSSPSARDRDRLRQAVLEEHGWILHRIWSTDWFHRPKEQLEKTISAIEQAKEKLVSQG